MSAAFLAAISVFLSLVQLLQTRPDAANSRPPHGSTGVHENRADMVDKKKLDPVFESFLHKFKKKEYIRIDTS